MIPTNEIMAIQGDTDVVINAPIVEVDVDVQSGGIFVARFGKSFDGHSSIPNAIERGAVAIIGETPVDNLSVPYIQVKNAQQVLGYVSSAWHDFPSRKLTVIGITGTDGKTTTSHILHQILKNATEGKTGFISTIAADFGGHSIPTGLHVTTPTAPYVQAYLAQMVEAGLSHCILEMTSHGLAQGRLNGVDIDVAVLTNVMHEHLDFHGSWEVYRDAKASMFHMLHDSARKDGQAKISILNADDNSFDYFQKIPADQVVSYAIFNQADFQAKNIQYDASGTHFEVNGHHIGLNLVGEFNVHNSLAAIAVARTLGINWDIIRVGLAEVQGVSGRMEQIDAGQDFLAIVDFAHTPNALKRALEAGRKMVADGRLIAVFGSAGLRDVEKRRLMAENIGKTGRHDNFNCRRPPY